MTAVSDQDVQAHDRDREDERLGPLARLKAADHCRPTDEEEDRQGHEPVARRGVADSLQHRLQTRRAVGRPKKPLGFNTRTPTMMARATASWRSPPTNGM